MKIVKLRDEFSEFCNNLLKEERAITKEQLEDAVWEKFKDRIIKEKWTEIIEKTGREKWKNEVDWIDATWTSNKTTIKLNHIILYAPSVGNLKQIGTIISRDDIIKTLCNLLDGYVLDDSDFTQEASGEE